MQTPNNVGNGAGLSRDGRWNQVHSTNMLPNTTPPVWNELPPEKVPSVPGSTNYVSSNNHGTSSVNNITVLSNQLVYNPPNYMNIPYPGNAVPNGYTTINPTRGINPQIIHGQNLLPTQNGQIIGGPGFSNQSALGRFISQPSAWPSNKTTVGAKKQKRVRTIFTSQQMMQLEQEFAMTPYLDRARRLELADFLGLNERTIKIWFQNRRMKKKKDQAESMEDSEDVSTSVPSPEMRNIHVPMPMHAPASMPRTSTPNSVPVTDSVQSIYPTFMSEEECQALYQQLDLQVQHYPEVQQLSSEVEQRMASPTSSAPGAIIEESSDLPWLKFSLNI